MCFKKEYRIQGLIYLDNDNFPVKSEITDKVKWLDKITIKAISEKQANKKAWKLFNFKYPDYKGIIWLF